MAPHAASALPESATILLVDDETVLVHAIGEFLRESGFIVLDAFSSQHSLDLAKEYPGRIDVLVSDVEFQPEIQVLFMSGYAEGPPDMKLPPGALFLQSLFVFPLRLKACVNCNPATKSGICIPIEFRLR